MSTETPQIIVITEEKKKRRGALLLVAGGAAALLAGGSTFALWTATDGFTGGEITAGDLNVVKTADTTFWDVSADRDDATRHRRRHGRVAARPRTLAGGCVDVAHRAR